MRHQGKITQWNDDKGFGFITPKGGGRAVFVHIQSFADRRRRPATKDVVTYSLRKDAKGRIRAVRVAVAGERVPLAVSFKGVTTLFAAAFVGLVAWAVVTEKLPAAVGALYLVASAVAFAAYAIDKSAAIDDRWRIRERTLHLFALMGGWPGAFAAQRLLRHKCSKTSFQVAFWTTVIANCGILAWMLSSAGAETIRSVLDEPQWLFQSFEEW